MNPTSFHVVGHSVAVVAFVVFTGTIGAYTQTSQARDPIRADHLAGRQIMSHSAMRAEGAGRAPVKKNTPSQRKELPTRAARLAFIRKAQIWAPTNVSRMD